jgi:hypothetical protein
MSVHGGVDVGRAASFPCVIDLTRRQVRLPETGGDVPFTVAWLQDQGVESICIDAPPRPNNGALRRALPPKSKSSTKRRVGEFQLGIVGCYGTPDVRPDLHADNGWVARGMDLYDALLDAHPGWTIDLGTGSGELCETHPTYAFKALIAFEKTEVVGTIQRYRADRAGILQPKRPRSRGGHAQRVELLRHAFAELQISVSEEIETRWQKDIDFADAAVCALMACWRAQKRSDVIPIGDSSEGAIYVRTPKPSWTVTAHTVHVPLQPAGTKAHRKWTPPPNAIILRLGKKGLGNLSKQDTIELTRHSFNEEGECWLPLPSKSLAKFKSNLDQVNGRLYLADGPSLRMGLVVGGCCIDDSGQTPYPGEMNPWPQLQEAHGWLKLVALDDREITEFQVRHGDEWRNGFTCGQTSRLWARVDEPLTVTGGTRET